MAISRCVKKASLQSPYLVLMYSLGTLHHLSGHQYPLGLPVGTERHLSISPLPTPYHPALRAQLLCPAAKGPEKFSG